MKRMLGIEPTPAMPTLDGPIHLSKIFFTPDNWVFESFRNLEVRYSEPKLTEAYRSSLPEVLRLNGSSLGSAVDGTYVIQGIEHPYRRGYLYSNNPIRFAVQSPLPEGPYVPVDPVPPIRPQKDVSKNLPVIGSAQGRQQCEMYDRPSRPVHPARHRHHPEHGSLRLWMREGRLPGPMGKLVPIA